MASEDVFKLICRIEELFAKRKILSARVVSHILKLPYWKTMLLLNELEKAGILKRIDSRQNYCACSMCPLSKICPYARTAITHSADIFGELYEYSGNKSLCSPRRHGENEYNEESRSTRSSNR